MKSTDKYQLNLIEPNDDFLPDPLNENTQKLETVLSQFQDNTQAALTSLITGLGSGGHTCRVAHGTYTGEGKVLKNLNFGFTPLCVFIGLPAASTAFYQNPVALIRGIDMPLDRWTAGDIFLTWTDTGVEINGTSSTLLNSTGFSYSYVAFGFSNESEPSQ